MAISTGARRRGSQRTPASSFTQPQPRNRLKQNVLQQGGTRTRPGRRPAAALSMGAWGPLDEEVQTPVRRRRPGSRQGKRRVTTRRAAGRTGRSASAGGRTGASSRRSAPGSRRRAGTASRATGVSRTTRTSRASSRGASRSAGLSRGTGRSGTGRTRRAPARRTVARRTPARLQRRTGTRTSGRR